MKLYEINNMIENFQFDIDEETGEIKNIDDLDELQMARDEKAENVALYIKNLNSDIEALKKEKAMFDTRIKQTQNKMESLKNYLKHCLKGDVLYTTRCTVSYRKSETVECDNLDMVPSKYLKYSAPTLDKKAVKDAIKNGLVTGCRLKEHVNITIK